DADEDAVDLLVEPHAAMGRCEPALDALEQLQPGVLLKAREQLADRRLRDVQEIGRPADCTALDDGLEGLGLPQVEPALHPVPFPAITFSNGVPWIWTLTFWTLSSYRDDAQGISSEPGCAAISAHANLGSLAWSAASKGAQCSGDSSSSW